MDDIADVRVSACDDIRRNAKSIHIRLGVGTMPCDGGGRRRISRLSDAGSIREWSVESNCIDAD
jgi:hypothetical protein